MFWRKQPDYGPMLREMNRRFDDADRDALQFRYALKEACDELRRYSPDPKVSDMDTYLKRAEIYVPKRRTE